jgi:hypothetical protein
LDYIITLLCTLIANPSGRFLYIRFLNTTIYTIQFYKFMGSVSQSSAREGTWSWGYMSPFPDEGWRSVLEIRLYLELGGSRSICSASYRIDRQIMVFSRIGLYCKIIDYFLFKTFHASSQT